MPLLCIVIALQAIFGLPRDHDKRLTAVNHSDSIYSQACITCTISIAYISAISKPIHFWFSPKLSTVQGLQSHYNRKLPCTVRSGSRFSTSTLKIGEGAPPPFWEGARFPFNTKSPGLRSTYTKWHLDASNHLATIEMGRKLTSGAPPYFWGGELGRHLAQCGLGQGPPLCQVLS